MNVSSESNVAENNVIMVGAGLVGSLLSAYLQRRGNQVTLIEKRPDLRQAGNIGGRSINLALSNRGWKALKEIGVEKEVKEIAIPMKGRMIHNGDGELTFQPYGNEGQAIYSVSRGGLNEMLINKAEKEGVQIHFNVDCEAIDFDKGVVFTQNYKTNTHQTFKGEAIIGTDGAFSAVRESLMKSGRFNYIQQYIEHGYKELCMPATSEGNFALDPSALHIWPRGQFMLIALPNLDRSFTCTLFLPFKGAKSFAALNSEEQIKAFFAATFPDALPLMPTLLEDYADNPTSSLVTIRCFPWANGKSLILGDASHAIVPFYGQGMNSGFEDCYLFNKVIDEFDSDWHRIFEAFQKIRKPDVEAIADLALQNFIEMRDLVADHHFLLRKKIERKLHELYPDKWIPLYSMVTFSDMGYADAMEIGKKQSSIMDEVMMQSGIENDWENLNFEQIVKKLAN